MSHQDAFGPQLTPLLPNGDVKMYEFFLCEWLVCTGDC